VESEIDKPHNDLCNKIEFSTVLVFEGTALKFLDHDAHIPSQ